MAAVTLPAGCRAALAAAATPPPTTPALPSHRRAAGAAPPLPPLRLDQARRLSAYLARGSGAAPALSKDSSVADLLASGVTSALLAAADVQPSCLMRAGATLAQLRALGFDALDLASSPILTGQLVHHFGKAQTAAAFLKSPDDAVALAASEAQRLLGVCARQLVKACAGAREHCTAVLQQLSLRHAQTCATADAPPAHWLEHMSVTDLVAAGVDAQLLERLGVEPARLPALLGLTAERDEAALASLGVLVR